MTLPTEVTITTLSFYCCQDSCNSVLILQASLCLPTPDNQQLICVQVRVFQILGGEGGIITNTNSLKWDNNITTVLKNAQQGSTLAAGQHDLLISR